MSTTHRITLIAVCLSLAAAAQGSQEAFAETGPLGFGPAIITQDMETDRPDITEGTQTVTQGHLQLEAGYTFTYDDESALETTSHVGPEVLLRTGLLDDLELRIAWEGYSHTEEETDGVSTSTEGISDVIIGIKHRMYDGSPVAPSVSFIFESSIPTGDDDAGSDELQPGFKLLWGYDLPKDIGIAGNINFDFPVEDEQRYFSLGTSLALGYAFGAVGTYVEYYGEFPSAEAPDTSSVHLANGGITYLVTENLQLDARIGFGLSDNAPDLFTGVGIAIRR